MTRGVSQFFPKRVIFAPLAWQAPADEADPLPKWVRLCDEVEPWPGSQYLLGACARALDWEAAR